MEAMSMKFICNISWSSINKCWYTKPHRILGKSMLYSWNIKFLAISSNHALIRE